MLKARAPAAPLGSQREHLSSNRQTVVIQLTDYRPSLRASRLPATIRESMRGDHGWQACIF